MLWEGRFQPWIQLGIFDDGPGIPKEQHTEIFDKFVQVNRPQGGAGYKGTGLGLPICKEIIDKHGGKIWVDSEPNQGSAFSFTLPGYHQEDFNEILAKELIRVAGAQSAALMILTGVPEELFRHPNQAPLVNKNNIEELRKEDWVFYDPDRHFHVIAARTNPAHVDNLAQRIKLWAYQALKDHRNVDVQKPKLGYALYPLNGTDPNKLYNQAFQSLMKNYDINELLKGIV